MSGFDNSNSSSQPSGQNPTQSNSDEVKAAKKSSKMSRSKKLADDDVESIKEEDMLSRRSRKSSKPKDRSRSKASKSQKKNPQSNEDGE